MRRGCNSRERAPRVQAGEAGDTLIEILIAIVVIGITVTALLGALMTTLTSSAEHRSLSSLDTVLGSFAQTVQAEVQGKPQSSTTTGAPLFVNCPTPTGSLTSPYQVASAPNPAAGPTGTSSILFLSGWAPGSVNVHLGSTYASGANAVITSGAQVPSSGNIAVAFIVPSSLSSGAQHVWVNDPNEASATQTVEAPSDFVIGTSSSNAPSLNGYSLHISDVEQWDPNAGVFKTPTPCLSSGMQLVSALGVAPNGVSASISFIVTGAAATTVTVAIAPLNATLEDTLTFTAQILPPNSTTTSPTGTVSWDFTGSPNTPPGSQTAPVCGDAINHQNPTTTAVSTTGGSTTATCTVSQAAAGNYDVTATYSGDQNYPQTPSQSYSFPVSKDNVTVAVAYAPANPVPGVSLTFTATITPATSGDPNPTGTVSWQFSSPTTPAPVCSNSIQNQQNTTNVATSGGQTTATCTISNPSNATYNVVATYNGDSNFFTATSTSTQATVSKGTVTLVVTHSPTNPTTASSLMFTAKLSWSIGDPTPNGTVSWTWTGTTVTPTPVCTNSINGQPNTTNVGTAGGQTTASCAISGLQVGSYTATATYNGNGSYNTSASASNTADVTVAPAGMDIQGVPNPQNGKPDSGDQIVYTFDQAMASSSILASWNGTGSKSVFAQFSSSHNVTQLQICATSSCSTQVNLGTVNLDDNGRYVGSRTITLNATMTMNAADTVVTITLTSSSSSMSALNPTSTATTLTWTPDSDATNKAGAACSTAPVTESGSPKKNY